MAVLLFERLQGEVAIQWQHNRRKKNPPNLLIFDVSLSITSPAYRVGGFHALIPGCGTFSVFVESETVQR